MITLFCKKSETKTGFWLFIIWLNEIWVYYSIDFFRNFFFQWILYFEIHFHIQLRWCKINFNIIIFVSLCQSVVGMLALQCFQLKLALRMFPVWGFVVGIFPPKALINLYWVFSTSNCLYLCNKILLFYLELLNNLHETLIKLF